ncbi:uncharacterized protein BDV14DRAFT_186423 [Aspergillus stella-maris]|uniref:uncharacterized protein n=1 Tax=Aspergillus stella-maris TaxID=1810926 RepID=UPI003CCDD261
MAGDFTSGETNETGYSHDNLRHVVITATSFALVISTIAVVLRLLCRRITKTKLFLDDYLMIGALVFEYGISFAGVVLLYNGLGTHINHVPPPQLTIYMKTLASGSFLYTACITLIKLSILAFYARLFPIRPMKVSVYIVGTSIVLWCFGVCLIGAVTCIPFRKLWMPELEGGCIDLAKFYYGLQVPNIVTDAVILFMPVRVVWGLNMPRVQRVLLLGIFMLGALTLIFDIIRLTALIELSGSGPDVTYNQVNASVWTCIEPCVGITAACLSNMRPLFNLLPDIPWERLGSLFEVGSLGSGRFSSSTGDGSGRGSGSERGKGKGKLQSVSELQSQSMSRSMGTVYPRSFASGVM